MANKPAITADQLISQLAARQHGLVSASQLAAAGLRRTAVSQRVKGGRLHRIHRGVYAVGHRALSQHGRWMAAVLACSGSALSHQDAAALLALLPAHSGPTHVSVPGDGGRSERRGLIVHRLPTLTPADLTIRSGIPVIKPARTLADLRRALPRERWEAAVDRARVLGLPIGEATTDPTRSPLERAFLRLCRRHRLPRPEVNVWVGPFLVDFLWRRQRLIVETDGFEHHRSRASFEADRARDARLKLMGYEVVRFTYRQVVEEPAPVAETVRVLLRGLPQPSR